MLAVVQRYPPHGVCVLCSLLFSDHQINFFRKIPKWMDDAYDDSTRLHWTKIVMKTLVFEFVCLNTTEKGSTIWIVNFKRKPTEFPRFIKCFYKVMHRISITTASDWQVASQNWTKILPSQSVGMRGIEMKTIEFLHNTMIFVFLLASFHNCHTDQCGHS